MPAIVAIKSAGSDESLEGNDDGEWWLEEAWKIRSIKQHWGYEVLILFLVDPQYDGSEKHRAVWAIEVRAELPTTRPLDKGIATMDLQRGHSGVGPTSMVAFANSAGGRLVIGVEDRTRAVTGVKAPLDLEERLANLVADSIEPRLVPEIESSLGANLR